MKQQIQVKVATWMVSSSSSASNWKHLDLIDWLRCHYRRWRWTPPLDKDFVALGDYEADEFYSHETESQWHKKHEDDAKDIPCGRHCWISLENEENLVIK